MSTQLERLSTTGRPPMPPEQLLRALLWKVPYRIQGERLLMEELDYNLLLRWFVGLNMDDPDWQPTTFKETGAGCWAARPRRPSSTHSLVGLRGGSPLRRALHPRRYAVGALRELEELPSEQRSEEPRAPDDPVNLTVNLHGERRCNDTHEVDHRPGRYTGRTHCVSCRAFSPELPIWVATKRGASA